MNLASNNIDGVGARKLADALEKNKTLVSIDLSGNEGMSHKIESGTDSSADTGINVLFKALQTNRSLKTLKLSNGSCYNMKQQDAQLLATVLKDNNCSITELDLSSNQLSSHTSCIFECLKENVSLTKLTIANNFYGREGAEALCSILDDNSTLVEVDLRNNNFMGNEVGEHLSSSLLNNQTITEFDLRDNHLKKDVLAVIKAHLDTIKHAGEAIDPTTIIEKYKAASRNVPDGAVMAMMHYNNVKRDLMKQERDLVKQATFKKSYGRGRQGRRASVDTSAVSEDVAKKLKKRVFDDLLEIIEVCESEEHSVDLTRCN